MYVCVILYCMWILSFNYTLTFLVVWLGRGRPGVRPGGCGDRYLVPTLRDRSPNRRTSPGGPRSPKTGSNRLEPPFSYKRPLWRATSLSALPSVALSLLCRSVFSRLVLCVNTCLMNITCNKTINARVYDIVLLIVLHVSAC